MSTLFDLPAGSARTARGSPTRFLAEPAPHSHAVQFYEEEDFLYRTVAEFVAGGLVAGERLLVIASKAHRDGFLHYLSGRDTERAIASGQLTLRDDEETLARFMVDGMPDPVLFRQVICEQIDTMQADGHGATRIRAYGEMVDRLWRSGNARAAIRLEELWNDLGRERSFELLCAYLMGNFYKEGDTERFLEICHNHSHVRPTELLKVDDPHARLREIARLQQRARALESELRNRKELEAALRDALRERGRVEEELRACVKREQEARTRAEANDQFKEMFLGILGHDLRNPLNTILTTVRLMIMRNDMGSENSKRLHRVVSSGVRMQRMISQLLDVTRLRLGAGIPVSRKEERDLVPLVVAIVDELRAGNPDRTLVLRTPSECLARFDADRLEQVVSNLLGNALMHGDPTRAIEVDVWVDREVARIRVHNHGRPIDPSFQAMLFDPFKRGFQQVGPSDGLGLGLHISERIVNAHGGGIDVESSTEAGTRFEAWFPREP